MGDEPYVLVVDNNPDAQALMAAWIGLMDLSVQVAGDGLEALQRINERTPAFVILDLKMPRMDGFSMLERLKDNPEKRDIPILVLTGGRLEEKAEKDLREMAIDVVKKGSDLDYIAQLIRNTLKGKQAP